MKSSNAFQTPAGQRSPAILLWLDYQVPSLNKVIRSHWCKKKERDAARKALSIALRSLVAGQADLTRIILSAAQRHSETP